MNKLTVIIPTYNRPLRLERAIEYWRDIPVIVHIIDGSEETYFDPLKLIDVSNIHYHRVPCEHGQNALINGFERQVYGADLPKTEYSAVCADDDFYSVQQLVASIEFLERDLALDAVCGRVLTYEKLHSARIRWWCKYLNWSDQASARSDNLYDRAFGKKNWFLFAVCRTEIWRNYIRSVYTVKSFTQEQTYAHEWLLKQLSSALFRTKFLEGILSIRQSTQDGENYVDALSWESWLNNPIYTIQVDELVDQLAQSLRLICSQDDECRRVARQLVDSEISRCNLNEKKVLIPKFSWRKILFTFSKLTPNFVVNFFVRLIPAERAVGLKAYPLGSIQKLLTRWGVSFSYLELQKIEKLLLMPREELRLRANI